MLIEEMQGIYRYRRNAREINTSKGGKNCRGNIHVKEMQGGIHVDRQDDSVIHIEETQERYSSREICIL